MFSLIRKAKLFEDDEGFRRIWGDCYTAQVSIYLVVCTKLWNDIRVQYNVIGFMLTERVDVKSKE